MYLNGVLGFWGAILTEPRTKQLRIAIFTFFVISLKAKSKDLQLTYLIPEIMWIRFVTTLVLVTK